MVGFFVAVAVTAGLIALEDSPQVEEAVATAQPTPQPTPVPQPTAAPDPTPAATAAPTLDPEVEVANTEPSEPSPAAPKDYVPTFVVGVDRTGYDANVSAQLVEPTATPAPATDIAAVPAATPQPTPTTEAQPGPPKEEAKKSKPVDAEAQDEDDATSDTGADDTSEGDSPQADDTDNDDGDGPTAAQWAALRNCESGGNYSIVSANGLYRGAYQFSQGTWDSTASWANPALVGTDPAEASPGQQDAMALALYSSRGASPWPTCGRYLS